MRNFEGRGARGTLTIRGWCAYLSSWNKAGPLETSVILVFGIFDRRKSVDLLLDDPARLIPENLKRSVVNTLP
jgi:hypothetical protein